jgi:hypothetical protein
MRIGEKQSEVFDWEACIFEPNGEVYESEFERYRDKPLDTGRLLYAKLRNALPRNVEVEVLWDHFHNEITGIITGEDFDKEVSFRDPIMARVDLVVYIEAIVKVAEEVASSPR